jgi:hypothetical protein
MTEPIVALQELLRNVGMELDGDLLPEGISVLARLLLGLEVSQHAGTRQYEFGEERQGYRNRHRELRRERLMDAPRHPLSAIGSARASSPRR